MFILTMYKTTLYTSPFLVSPAFILYHFPEDSQFFKRQRLSVKTNRG